MSYTELPTEEVATSQSNNYRISDGALCKGRQGEEERAKFLQGRLLRVGIYEGTLDTGEEYAKLEAEIETATGKVSISAPLKNATSGKPTYSSCISFAEGLLAVSKGEIVKVEAAQGSKPNRYGKYTTYANVYKLTNTQSGWIATRSQYGWPGQDPTTLDLDAKLDTLVGLIREHDAYGERAVRERVEAGAAPWDVFAAALETHGWPPIGAAQAEYLEIASRIGKVKYTDLADVPTDVFGQMAAVVESGKPMPKAVQAVADRLAANPKAGAQVEEYDPFADE